MGEELQQLQSRGFIENANIPDLGPIPASSPVSAQSASGEVSSEEEESDSNSEEEEEEEEEAEDAAAEDDDEEEEYEEKGTKGIPIRPATRPLTRRLTSKTAPSTTSSDQEDTTKPTEEKKDKTKSETKPPARKRKRGRPPKIDTPEEARIRSVLRAIRKVKDSDGRQLFLEFEKLPDPEQYPDYYKEIKKPIALDHITVVQGVK